MTTDFGRLFFKTTTPELFSTYNMKPENVMDELDINDRNRFLKNSSNKHSTSWAS
jgi:hypothetical protein